MPKSTTGVLNIDKSAGPTSHDVVSHVRRLTKLKTGHGGTLDPFATGVLLVAIGSATRLLEYTRHLPKTYLATITLGAASDTDDRTGKITPHTPPSSLSSDTSPSQGQESRLPAASSLNTFSPLRRGSTAEGGVGVASREQILQTLQTFFGPIQQIPPQYSAVKVAGKRAYAQARVGETVALKPRPVVIHSIKLLAYNYPTLKLEIVCGGGTYIRALARDIGEALGTGAYVQELRRTAIGPFDVSHAITLDKLSALRLDDSLSVNNLPILSPETLVAHLPRLTLDAANVAKFKRGQGIDLIPARRTGGPTPSPSQGEGNASPYEGEASAALGEVNSPIAIFDKSNSLIGIGKYEPMSSLLHPQKVL